MSKYILESDIALRTYNNILFCCYKMGHCKPIKLTPEEFIILRQCDGTNELEEDDILLSLLERKLIRKSERDASLNNWQEYKAYNNPLFPLMTLEITQRCNFNCLHCFAAADNKASTTEMSYEDIIKILDQAEECGIQAVKITGGEPMLHPDFIKILDAINKRNMWVYQINTNGYFLNEEMIYHLCKYSVKPIIKMSYDGIGFHDVMRGVKAVEEKTIEAIKKSTSSGFHTIVDITVNKKNIDVIIPTLKMLEEIGVQRVWIARAMETPRWEENKNNNSLDWNEYYIKSLEIIKEYIKKEHKMGLYFWGFIDLDPIDKKYSFPHVKSNPNKFNPKLALCKGCYGDISVSATGTVYPCLQMSGYFKAHNVQMENALIDSLSNILNDSACVNISRMRVDDKKDCKECKFYKTCSGGYCMCTAVLTGGHFYSKNEPACIFFYDKWDLKAKAVLKDWENISK